MPPMSQAQQQAAIIQQNIQNRSVLLASAPRMRKNLGTFTAPSLGSTTRVKLFNVGITTNVQLVVSCPITIGTATATLSPRGPYNLMQRVKITDYDGTDRINLSGLQLFIANCIRSRQPFGYNNANVAVVGGVVTNPAAVLTVGNQTIQFVLNVPLAFDKESDLRGSILSQTALGDMYLTIDWNTSLYTNGAIDSVFNGAATTTVVLNGVTGPSVQVFQEYLLPQNVGNGLPLPIVDLNTVYEWNGMLRTSDNLAANAEKLLNYPNYRSVIGFYYNYANGATMLATDISLIRLIANGNNVLQEFSQLTQILSQRDQLGGDIGAGMYWNLHRGKPMETALFGNVQAGVTPTSVGANSFVEVATESFYTKGAALPGVNQG